MDSNGLSEEEYGHIEFDELIQKEFFDSLDSDEEAEMMMIMSIQQEMDREMEQILKSKGSIKGRRVLNRDRAS